MGLSNLERWHEIIRNKDMNALRDVLHDEAVFHSPVVHTPQRGKALTYAYLAAAFHVLGDDNFAYLRDFDCGSRAVIEFTTEIDGIQINGIDMIEWDSDGKIIDFKVMVRPLKAIQKLHALMAEMLEKMSAG